MAWAAKDLEGMLLVSDRPILHDLALLHSQRTDPSLTQLRGAIKSKARQDPVLSMLSRSAATSAQFQCQVVFCKHPETS